jgi:hypothetical protein
MSLASVFPNSFHHANGHDIDNDTVNAHDNANDNAYYNDNVNANGFPGHPHVSCLSLDSPRPWPTSALLAPFCLAGARCEDLYLVKKLVCLKKNFKHGCFSNIKNHALRTLENQIILRSRGGLVKSRAGGGSDKITPPPLENHF